MQLTRLSLAALVVSALPPAVSVDEAASDPARTLVLEIDSLSSVPAVSPSVSRAGATHTLASILEQARIVPTIAIDPPVTDLHPGVPYRDAELHGLLTRMKQNAVPTDPRQWYVQALILTKHEQGLLGILFAREERDRFAVFAHASPNEAVLLRTVVHELGHALNLFHNDGDADARCCARVPGGIANGRSLMNQTRCAGPNWEFVFSPKELEHLLTHPEPNIKPRSGVRYDGCIATHRETCR